MCPFTSIRKRVFLFLESKFQTNNCKKTTTTVVILKHICCSIQYTNSASNQKLSAVLICGPKMLMWRGPMIRVAEACNDMR